MTDALLVWTTFANEEDAARVVRTLVEERLIACGNLLPGVRSLYRWKGAVADEREVMAILKTRKQDWVALLSRLHELHPPTRCPSASRCASRRARRATWRGSNRRSIRTARERAEVGAGRGCGRTRAARARDRDVV